MAYTLGIDIGSGFSKAVVCEDSRIRSYAIAPSGGNYRETAEKVVEEALNRIHLSSGDISNIRRAFDCLIMVNDGRL